MKKKFAIVLSLILVVALVFGLSGCGIKATTQEFTTANTSGVRIGVISDTQLSGAGTKDAYYYNYVSALKTLKDKNVDTIIFAGDLADVMTSKASKLAGEAWAEAFGASDKAPIKNYIMGNHDYWLPNFVDCWDIPSKGKMQGRFTKATGEKPYSHKVINGYHFINASPSNGDMSGAYDDVIEWLDQEIKTAISADGDKPIFVNTHFAPKDTVILSSEYGEVALHELFKKYPQVVSISGHSHASLMSERSIWQGEYTALQTQSLSYACFDEKNLANGMNLEGKPSGMVIDVTSDSVHIDRIDTNTGKSIANPWTLRLKIADHLNDFSVASRSARAETPIFPRDNVSYLKYNNKLYINFLPAKVNFVTNVMYYHLRIRDVDRQLYVEFDVDGKSQDYLRYMSDFYEQVRGDSVIIEFNVKLPVGDYEMEVTAEEEFGKVSEKIHGFLVI